MKSTLMKVAGGGEEVIFGVCFFFCNLQREQGMFIWNKQLFVWNKHLLISLILWLMMPQNLIEA